MPWHLKELKQKCTQIAETIENVGGDINAYTSKEITAYYVKLLADDLPYGIDIVTDILQNLLAEGLE